MKKLSEEEKIKEVSKEPFSLTIDPYFMPVKKKQGMWIGPAYRWNKVSQIAMVFNTEDSKVAVYATLNRKHALELREALNRIFQDERGGFSMKRIGELYESNSREPLS